ncbi:MAG: hypothetical protein KKF50_00650 [Nanoarchaeota archaeon]|nr:hypothetical protein [Nanoarchaeota archaeon]
MDMKKIGVVFILGSIFLSLANLTFTGAVVGSGHSVGYWSLVAIVSFVVGVFLLVSGSRLETIVGGFRVSDSKVVSKEKIFRTFEKNFPYAAPAVVLDTSFLISYSNNRREMVDYLKSHTDVIVPEEVINEFNDTDQKFIKDYLRKETKRPDESYKKYIDHAWEVLNTGKKATFYDILIGEEDMPPEGSEIRKEYALAINDLKTFIIKDGKSVNEESIRKKAKKHWPVSDADVAVLAVTMDYEAKGKRSMIMEKDSDFKEALKYMQRNDNVQGISCFDAYGKVYSE